MDKVVEAIGTLSHHEWLEVASWISQIVLAFVAIVSAYLVLIQVREIASDSAKQTRQLQANFLFDLDKLYESDAFSDARLRFSKMRLNIEEETKRAFGHLDPAGQHAEFTKLFSVRLYELKANNADEYHHIMKLAGFFETAAKLADSGYVKLDDIYDLYLAAIKPYYRATCLHIRRRQTDEQMPELFEHFMRLGEKD